jgi:hypothetical protein
MMLSQADLPPEVQAQFMASTGITAGAVLTSLCITIILAPIFFLIGSLIYFAVAKLLGGVGTFEQNSYILATFAAPLMIVSGALSVIPVAGSCLGIVVWIYQIFLTYLSMKATHRLSTGSALVVALTPIIIGLICGCALFFGMFSLLAGAAGSGGLE